MEKFGIFNILSALGNLTEEARQDAPETVNPPPAQSCKTQGAPVSEPGIFTGEERMNKMLSVLERHEQISKRIDKNNKPPR